MQEMVIYGVSFDMVGKQPIVLLKAVDTNKFLPIWIGHPEAAAILMKLQGASTPRPMTHDLLFDMLGELEVSCTRVSVTELRENTFYASITLSVNGREVDIDSRPSRRARARRPLRRADLRRRGRHRRVRDRVRARGRGHRGGRGQVQGVPRPGHARGLQGRRSRGSASASSDAFRPASAPSARRLDDPRDQARRTRCPAASAASGSSDVSVSPGIALASSSVSSPRRRPRASGRRARSPSSRASRRRPSASSCARAVASGADQSAGHTNAVRPIS